MKFIKVLLSSILIFSIVGCRKNDEEVNDEVVEIDNEEFNTFLNEAFLEIMYGDIITLHFGLIDYEYYDADKPEVSLGEFDDYETLKDDHEEDVETFSNFDRTTLSASQQLIYDKIAFNLEINEEFLEYQEYEFLFRPSSSIIENLKTIFNEYRILDQEKLDDYITLLEDFDRYLDDALVITKEQANSGIFMEDSIIDSTVEQIENLLSENGISVFTKGFNDKLNTVDYLTEDEKNSYITRNEEIVYNEVIPALEEVRDVLISLKGSNQYGPALASYPEGKEYYEVISKYNTSLDYSIDELYEYLETSFYDGIAELYTLSYDTTVFEDTNVESDPYVLIDTFFDNYESAFPSIGEVDYKIEFLDPAYTDPNVLAYYLVAPIDDYNYNSMKINEAALLENPIGFYETLAHEAVPGHLLQNVYAIINDSHPINYHLSYLGSGEGYAMYVSKYAYMWATDYDEDTIRALTLNTKISYIANAMMDIGVNYYGWSIEELQKNFGLIFSLDEESATELYYGLIENPGSILSYGVGFAYYEDLYDNAKEHKDFDIIEFHEALLTIGEAPLEVVKQEVEKLYN